MDWLRKSKSTEAALVGISPVYPEPGVLLSQFN